MRKRSLLVVSLSVMLLSGCGGNESSNSMKIPPKAEVSLINISDIEVKLDRCVLIASDKTTPYDSEYINLRNVTSLKTMQVGEPAKEHHTLFIDQRAIAVISDNTRLQVAHIYETCSGRY